MSVKDSKVRILFLTYFFPPDLCAGSFRAKALVEALLDAYELDVEIDVVSTVPNRYVSHNPDESDNFQAQGCRLIRVPLPEKKQGFGSQIQSFVRYANGVRKHLRLNSGYDLVLATTSRLMTGCLGAYCAKRLGVPLYLDVRDIFTETVDDVFPGALLAPVRGLFRAMEARTIMSAKRVNLVSKGFLPYFEARYPRDDYRFFTNGVDDEFLAKSEVNTGSSGKHNGTVGRGKLEVLYAGNIGDGQGLERILPELASRLSESATFTVVGDGNTSDRLRSACEAVSAPVTFFGAVPRAEIFEHYRRADVLFLHLNDLPAFTRVLPSKLFEYAATGKPILAGVAGYARDFIQEHVTGAAVFHPCDVSHAENAFRELCLKDVDRSAFSIRYARTTIMKKMAEDILEASQS